MACHFLYEKISFLINWHAIIFENTTSAIQEKWTDELLELLNININIQMLKKASYQVYHNNLHTI
jgi:hypothetical protein